VDVLDLDKRPQCLTKTARLINFLLYWLVWAILAVKGVDFKLAGANAVAKKGPVIIIGAPHTSLADAVVMIASIRRSYAGIGMAELRNGGEWPWIIGKGFDLLGHIPIEATPNRAPTLPPRRCMRYVTEPLWQSGRMAGKSKKASPKHGSPATRGSRCSPAPKSTSSK
jgi:1-acyl-sn-glycerol-3-phosphate acyltransferase